MSSETLIKFEYVHCEKDEIEQHEAAFREADLIAEIQKGLAVNLTITSFIVEVIKNASNSTDIYSVMATVKGPHIDINAQDKGDSAAPVTTSCIHSAIRQLREIKDKMKP